MSNHALSRHHGRDDSSVAGFSLLELVVVLAVATVVLGGAVLAVHRLQVGHAEVLRRHTIEQTGTRVISRLREELAATQPLSINPVILVDSSFIRFQKVTGWTGSQQQLSPEVTIGFRLAPGESPNGADDNGDGLADEGLVVQTDADGNSFAIAANILALRFNQITNGVSFAVDVGVINSDGILIQRTFSQQVTFRN